MYQSDVAGRDGVHRGNREVERVVGRIRRHDLGGEDHAGHLERTFVNLEKRNAIKGSYPRRRSGWVSSARLPYHQIRRKRS